jgi:hypothetical protein
MSRLLRLIGLLLLVLLVTSCAQEAVTETHVDLGEFYVSVEGEPLEAGVVTLTVENYGEYPHTLVISSVTGAVLAATEIIPAGDEVQLQLNLTPGDYSFTCRIVNGDGAGGVIDHYQEGMSAPVAVVPPAA